MVAQLHLCSCGNLPWIAAIFYGLKPAILAIVAPAVIRIGSRALKNEVMWTLAAAAFVAIFFVHLPFPLIILSAAAIGFVGGKWKRDNSWLFVRPALATMFPVSVVGDR
jgi:chromate transporter